MNDELAARIASFLDAHHVMSLATLGDEGPHAANLFYVRDEFALIWVSDPSSRHSVNIAAHPKVAATVAPDYSDFPAIRGLQIAGYAGRIAGAQERKRAENLLRARYSFLNRMSEGPRELVDAYTRAEFHVLKPDRIALIDNTRGFGSKMVLDIASNR